jgi:uncharacterized protein (DUF58 family)
VIGGRVAKAVQARPRLRRALALLTLALLALVVIQNMAVLLVSGRVAALQLVVTVGAAFVLGLLVDERVERRLGRQLEASLEAMRRTPTTIRISEDEAGLVALVQTLGGDGHVIRLPEGMDDQQEIIAFVAAELGFQVELAQTPPVEDE